MPRHSAVVHHSLLCLLLVGGLAACASADGGSGSAQEALVVSPCMATARGPSLDVRRSLAVTDPEILSRFSFQRVMTQIVALGGEVGQTPLGLYQQWWDTQNVGKDELHCNGFLNGFPVQCPRAEGRLTRTNPFVDGPDAMVPIALFNRFDLAPKNGAHCGEYRIIFAKKSGQSFSDRALIIFEGALTNPDPKAGLNACRPVAQFWAGLSSVNDVAARAAALDSFYFQGLSGFLPVVHPNHYGLGTASGGYGSPSTKAGQIRTNQFMNGPGQIWQLREFQLAKTCAEGDKELSASVSEPIIIGPPVVCQHLVVSPVSVKSNPFGPLFSASSTHPQAPAFRASFLDSVASLAPLNDVNLIGMSTNDVFNAGQSNAQGSENDYRAQLSGKAFVTSINTRLQAIGSPLTATNVADRATTQSCGGCHQLSNGVNLNPPALPALRWPSSNGFVHVDEQRNLSPALLGTFLPARKTILENFLASATCGLVLDAAAAETQARASGVPASTTLSGRTTH